MAHTPADLKDSQKLTACQLKEQIGEKVIIDVRNPSERAENGFIDPSVNIPFPELENALALSNDVFKTQYGISKPTSDTSVVFHCQRGARGSRAVLVANSAGLTKAQNLDGGYSTWNAKS